jgi:predicted DsbA family dithiol-disulfide isomerase
MFPNGLQAAFAAECVGEQGRFQDMSAILYERQQDWKGKDDPYSIFAEYVQELGLDGATYQSCLSENRQRSRVRSGVLTGARLGVRGTPSFLVDGFPLVGAQPVEVWNDILTARMNELESAGQD